MEDVNFTAHSLCVFTGWPGLMFTFVYLNFCSAFTSQSEATTNMNIMFVMTSSWKERRLQSFNPQ